MSNGLLKDGKNLHEVKLYTRPTVREVRVEWVLEDFPLLCLPSGEKMESSLFYLPGDKARCWSLQIYPNGVCKEACAFISVFLNKHFKRRVATEFEFSILGSDGQKKHALKTSKIFDSDPDWGYHGFIRKDALFDHKRNFLDNGNLRLQCELKILDSMRRRSFIQRPVPYKTDWKQVELRSMLENTETSDIRLKVGGKEFMVHKAVLGARSPVFAAMWKHGLEEVSSGEVKVSDISAEVMAQVVRYIYTGESPDRLGEMTEDLLAAADKYDLEGLKKMCTQELLRRLTVSTAAQLLVIADTYQATEMKAAVLNFISSHASQVLVHPSWEQIMSSYASLVAEVNASIVKNLVLLKVRN